MSRRQRGYTQNNDSRDGGLLDMLGKPFVLFILGGIVTFGLQWAIVGQRVSVVEEYITEHKRVSVTREDLNSLRSEVKDFQRAYITRDEFNAAFSSLQRGIADLKDEVRDLVRSQEGRRAR
jgi:hypothetical protein